jgi:dihydrofolate reductase
MNEVIASISMSLDGFITAPDDTKEHGLGVGGEVLHHWLGDGEIDPREVDVLDELFAETGAIVMGRHSYEVAEEVWGSEPPFQVPAFVLTHRPQEPIVRGRTTFHFVHETIEQVLDRAAAAAGGKDVALHGATCAQQALRAGRLDILQIHLVPVLLGGGKRLLENFGDGQVPLEITRVIEAPDVTHLRYRVGKRALGG